MNAADDEKNVRFRLPKEMKEQWDLLCDRRRISQQDAIESLIRFALSLDAMDRQDVTLSMILGQVEPASDLIALVVERLRAFSIPAGKGKSLRNAAKPARPDREQ